MQRSRDPLLNDGADPSNRAATPQWSEKRRGLELADLSVLTLLGQNARRKMRIYALSGISGPLCSVRTNRKPVSKLMPRGYFRAAYRLLPWPPPQ